MRFRTLIAAALLALPTVAAANDVKDQIQLGAFGIETGMFNVLFAKELCTCLYVDDLSMDECVARDNLPAAIHKIVKFTPKTKITDPSAPKTLRSDYVAVSLLKAALKAAGLGESVTVGPGAVARYVDDRVGCVLEPPH